MSDYANKLSSISEKKLKLIEEEKELVEKRKKEIGQLAQKFDLLTVSDDLISGMFSYAKKAIASKTEIVKEWESLGGKSQKIATRKSAKISKDATSNIPQTA